MRTPTRLVRSIVPVLLVTGCMLDPGPAPYDGQEIIERPKIDTEPTPGPDPYEPGEKRLALGMFYEGGASETMPLGTATEHYYIYEGTYTQVTSTDRVEGLESDVIVHAGIAWWGGGIHWDAAKNLSTWTKLHISFASSDPAFAEVEIGMKSGTKEVRLGATGFGYVADGSWHHLEIPLVKFAQKGLDLAQITSPLMLLGGAGTSGSKLKVDNVYFSAE